MLSFVFVFYIFRASIAKEKHVASVFTKQGETNAIYAWDVWDTKATKKDDSCYVYFGAQW